MANEDADLHQLFKLLFQAHPWHGVSPGKDAPATINAYIEIVPTDVVKYELDKASGHLHVDRPQRFSSMCPTL
jgi:inorganic pyrophosphatase